MKLIIQREYRKAQYYREDLGNNVSLDMVLIPGGKFLMGSPEDEPNRSKTESPQHEVTVPSFFMGKYPVTQAQWQAVVALPKIDQYLKPNLSRFPGANRPVENVSWQDAKEFCRRLAQRTGRPYCLPSEAEWEYACRAGTTTPFYFGETITTDLANYYGTSSYGRGLKGIYRQETTPVGSFPANAFGLYDLHGNVWEWCEDHWHDSYQQAPTDGSAWLSDNDNQFRSRLLRGGSWGSHPDYCRSAYRGGFIPGVRVNDLIGFRLVCAVEWTL